MSIQGIGNVSGTNLRYVWVAEYNNGTTLSQFDQVGKENLFSDINQEELKILHFASIHGDNVISVALSPGSRVICYRRHRLLNSCPDAGCHEPGHDVEYHLGYQKTVDGKNFKSIMIIDSNGNVTLTEGV